MAKLCAYRGPWAHPTTGTILTGGKVWTYQTGSFTPKAVYTDAAGLVPETNPVILDSGGCKTFYLATDTAYRFEIQTSAGITTETIDNITPLTTVSSGVGGSNIDISDYALITQAGKDLYITPGAAGKIYLNGLQMPTAAPTTNQTFYAVDATTLAFGNPGSGTVQSDSNPILAGDLVAGAYFIKFNDAAGIIDANGHAELYFYKTASAVNYVSLTNSATGNGPTLAAVGSDSNINLNLNGKGTGGVVANKVTSTGAVVASTTLNVTGTSTLAGMVQGGTTFPTSVGAANTVITAAGAGVTSWSLPATVKLNTQTVSGVSTVMVTGLTSTYRGYLIAIDNVLNITSPGVLSCRASTNGGSSADSGSNYAYAQSALNTGGFDTSESNSATSIILTNTWSNQANKEGNFNVMVNNPSSSSWTSFSLKGSHWESAQRFTADHSEGVYMSTTAVNAVQFNISAGTISGTFTLYGIL